MHQQSAFYLNKLRIPLAGLFAVAFVLLVSALVTALGHNSILDSKTVPASGTASVSASSDIIASDFAGFAAASKQDLTAAGRAIYKTCYSITKTTNHTGAAIARGSADTADGVGRGVVFINQEADSVAVDTFRGWERSVMFTFHIPGKVVSSLANVHAVSDIVQPSDNNPVPVINTKLSAAELASISAEMQQNAENQQKVKALQAAQAADNRGLNGVVVAGDPRHGGYPTKWNNAPTDSLVDNWGMLNRECVSYTAWKVYQTYGYMPFWGGKGNANEWVDDAQAAGIQTGSTPKVNSVAVSMDGYYGHAMWVEKVQGNMIYVSQYNYDEAGHYSEMWVNGSDFTYIYFK